MTPAKTAQLDLLAMLERDDAASADAPASKPKMAKSRKVLWQETHWLFR